MGEPKLLLSGSPHLRLQIVPTGFERHRSLNPPLMKVRQSSMLRQARDYLRLLVSERSLGLLLETQPPTGGG